ncbi:MAG: class I SAM-dependent methyltransferase [bacterium]|nr:class I SAM-dependent methyltransferase [bacterium]
MMKQANDFGGGFYDDPVVYDILAAPGTEGELDVLESVVGEWAAPVSGPRLWLEPACGTGRCLRGWAARGQRAVGFDVSGTMVADARRRLRRRGLTDRAEARVADMAGLRRPAAAGNGRCRVPARQFLPPPAGRRRGAGSSGRDGEAAAARRRLRRGDQPDAARKGRSRTRTCGRRRAAGSA